MPTLHYIYENDELTMMTPTQQTTLEAFLIAVSQLDTLLTDELKQSIHQIGERLAQSDYKVIDEIPTLVKKDDLLEKLYQDARQSLRGQYQIQERDKQDIIYSDTLTLSGIASNILTADDFKSVAQTILKKLQNKKNDFLNIWQRKLTLADAREKILINSVLKLLEDHTLTIRDLSYKLNIPQDKVEKIIKNLWNQGKVDTIQGGILRKIFPAFRKQKSFNTDAYFTLTSLGFFNLHPLVKNH